MRGARSKGHQTLPENFICHVFLLLARAVCLLCFEAKGDLKKRGPAGRARGAGIRKCLSECHTLSAPRGHYQKQIRKLFRDMKNAEPCVFLSWGNVFNYCRICSTKTRFFEGPRASRRPQKAEKSTLNNVRRSPDGPRNSVRDQDF